MADESKTEGGIKIKRAPAGLAALAMVGPSFVWAAEYIGSGEVILATRTGAILGTAVLWAIVVGIFLKFWIGMSGARYTVCTGEGMIDMLARMPGPRHWAVWVVLAVQFLAATFSIGAVVTAAGVFVSSLIPSSVVPGSIAKIFPGLCGWAVTIVAVAVVWSGMFNVLKMVMSFLVLIIVLGVIYVAAHVFPGVGVILRSLAFSVPGVPQWAASLKGVSVNPWKEVLPLLGWGAGGFASQVWYTYWVIGAGYGATAGRGYGRPADTASLGRMTRDAAERIKGWCRVLYLDSSLAMVIGIVVTGAFYIAGAGVLGPAQVAPEGPDVAIKLSTLFSSKWGSGGGFLFMLAGAAALISTQIGQLAGWPRLLADSCRICIPGYDKRFKWKTQFRMFLLFFLCANMVIVFFFKEKPVVLVQFAALMDGLLLTPMQAILVAVGLFVVMPKLLSREALSVLRPSPAFAVGLVIAFLVFGYFCVVQMPSVLFGK
ncbi:MAG: Nramp family divalent metal transporter [Sedimentisphaerales bacterium]|nr:Nramp family divalent metal transporter [Sedimentisphaerales bacterium]